jgi:hypothetical protein
VLAYLPQLDGRRSPASHRQTQILVEQPCARALVDEHSAGALGAEGEREMNRCEWPGGHHLNDDKSPLIGLLSCIVCKETMNLDGSAPDAEGKDIIQYRCKRCGRIERVLLLRRNRDAAG